MRKTLKATLLQSLAFMGLLFVLNLSLRAVFIFYFKDSVNGVNLAQWELFLANAFRYDGQIIGVMSVVFFALNFVPKEQIVKIYAFLVIFISAFVGIANIGFYEIYQDVFNATLLGLIYDDRKAIFETALGGDYHFTSKILLWLFVSVLFYALWAFLHAKIAQIQGKRFRFVFFAVFALACLFEINGQIGLKGVALSYRITPVTNTFLRKITHGSFRDLLYVYRSYAHISNSKFSDYTSESPEQVVRNFFHISADKHNGGGGFNLTQLLEKQVSNPSKTQIQHIFYIIAESLSAWHLDESTFKELGIKSDLLEFIEQSGAYRASVFVQNADATMKSLDVQISGLFQIEIPLSLSVGKNPVFKMSAGYIFKDLGFKTTFFYGGSGTWHKIDNYAISQGFDEIKFSNHITQFAKEKGFTPPFKGAWGAYDHYLYEFIKDYTLANKDTKSFAMVMSVSNHGPWDAPVEQFGVDYDKIDKFLKAKQLPQDDYVRRIFSHFIYQDKMLARFVKETSKVLPNSLFIITGDHGGTSFYTQTSKDEIPLIIYSPILKPKVLANVGSHIDITPTITELVAPNAYKYASFGAPLLSNDYKKAFEKRNALGYKLVANERFLYDGFKIEYFKDKKPQNDDESLAKSLFENLKRAKALSWWIFKNGYIVK